MTEAMTPPLHQSFGTPETGHQSFRFSSPPLLVQWEELSSICEAEDEACRPTVCNVTGVGHIELALVLSPS